MALMTLINNELITNDLITSQGYNLTLTQAGSRASPLL